MHPEFSKRPRVDVEELRLEVSDVSAANELVTTTTGQYSYKGLGEDKALIESSDGIFTQDFVGGTITVSSPQNVLPLTQSGDAVYTDGDFPTKVYRTVVRQVLNDRQIVVDPYKVDIIRTSGRRPIKFTYVANSFGNSNHSTQYRQVADFVAGSNNFESYLNMEIADIQLDAGSISYLQPSVRSARVGTYTQLPLEPFQVSELFTVTGAGGREVPAGRFPDVSFVTTNWEYAYFGGFANSHTPLVRGDVFDQGYAFRIPGIPVDGNLDDLTAQTRPFFFMKVNPKQPVEVFADNNYILSFKMALRRNTDWILLGAENTINPRVSIHLSGSAVRSGDVNFGREILSYNPKMPFTSSFTYLNGNGILTQNQFVYNEVGDAGNLSSANISNNVSTEAELVEGIIAYRFTPRRDGFVTPVWRLNTGEVAIADVSIKSDVTEGRTPTHVKLLTKLPTIQSNDRLDIKMDFLNEQKEVANFTFVTQSIPFSGSNTFVSGEDNVLSGKMFIGSETESFIDGTAANDSSSVLINISGSGVTTNYRQFGDGAIQSTATASFAP